MQGFDLLALILCKKGRLVEAEEKAHIAVDVKVKTLGNHHPEVAQSLLGIEKLNFSHIEGSVISFG